MAVEVGDPLREPAGEKKKDRKKKRDTEEDRERERKISRRYSLERWSVEKRYAVLEFRPFCAPGVADASYDFNRRISKSLLRPAASTSTATIQARSGSARSGNNISAIHAVAKPGRRIRQKCRP